MTIRRLATAFILCFILSQYSYANASAKVWEYKAKTIQLLRDKDVSKSLNAIGQDKWELVNCAYTNDGEMFCVFKRPKG